jgi:hypothetical protein
LARYASALADGMERALPRWVERRVIDLVVAWSGAAAPDIVADARAAGVAAAAAVGPEIRALLAADIDDQHTTPLALVRLHALRYPTAVLVAAGVAPVVRDEAAEELFPDDVYDLAPGSFADLDPELADLGVQWGAAKAFEHLRRHRSPR